MSVPRFAVVECPRCGDAWSAELRNASSACPRCRTRCDLRKAQISWTGDDAREAQGAAASRRANGHETLLELPTPQAVPRHDSALDAAAAKGQGITNRSDRAEAVALWLTRLQGGGRHEALLEALERAGLDRDRATREVVRMLAMDLLWEPRAGFYRTLQD